MVGAEKGKTSARVVPYIKRKPLQHVIQVKKEPLMYAFGKSDIVDLQQNTDAWLEWRKKGVGSSLVGTIVGVNGALKENDYKPYKTPIMAWRQFLGKLPKDEVNYHMQRGHDQEELITQKYASVTGNKIGGAACYQHRTQPWAKVSIDRRILEDNLLGMKGEGILEAKCPMKVPGAVKLDHMCQVQYQMYVAGAKWCDYVAYNKEWPADEGPAIWRIPYSKEFAKWLLARVQYFMECTESGEEPDLHYIKHYCFGSEDSLLRTVKKSLERRFGTFLPPLTVAYPLF